MTRVNILAGPPACPENDMEVVRHFLSLDGCHIVCGGSSALMVSRCTGFEISIPLDGTSGEFDENTLPAGRIGDEIYATEGIITLKNVAKALEEEKAPIEGTGEYLLYSRLTSCDEVNVFWGCAVNSCHPSEIDYFKKEEILIYIIEKLKKLNIRVNIFKK